MWAVDGRVAAGMPGGQLRKLWQATDGGSLHQRGDAGNGKRWLNKRDIPEVESTELKDRSCVE